LEPAQDVKVFCFFSSEKKILLFLKKKKQKDFYFLVLFQRTHKLRTEKTPYHDAY